MRTVVVLWDGGTVDDIVLGQFARYVVELIFAKPKFEGPVKYDGELVDPDVVYITQICSPAVNESDWPAIATKALVKYPDVVIDDALSY